ncbi:hypothetical protein ACVRZR_08115 [Streptococcus entericus]|uniref:hypothetical protein n=1 Tax=Streptococcus entericus TaxID=155680 RepID=UPI00036994CB|nr:hypothetical protein [Streptococcus entericus]
MQQLKTVITIYSWHLILITLAFWLSLFTPIWNILGDRQSDVVWFIYLIVFPILGIIDILLALLSRQVKLAIFGLILILSFPLSWGLGHLIFDP